MKKFIIHIVFCIFVAPVFSQEGAAEIYIPGDESTITPPAVEPDQRATMLIPTNPVLWDNGPLVTHPGAGFGGADVSAVQSSLGMTISGFNHDVLNNYWVADDFTVPAGGWHIEGFGFYAYQTFSGIPFPSPIFGVHLIIYDGPPNNPGSNLILGDGITNRITSSDFVNIYRTQETNLGSNDRPIFLNSCMFNYFLAEGTYWVAWQTDGSTSFSGPWCPPVTLLGQSTTGNGLQSLDGTSTWNPIQDIGPQGLPFLVYGSFAEVPIANWAIIIGVSLILTFAIFRFRRIS